MTSLQGDKLFLFWPNEKNKSDRRQSCAEFQEQQVVMKLSDGWDPRVEDRERHYVLTLKYFQ